MRFTAFFITLLFATTSLGSPNPKTYSTSNVERDTLTSTNAVASAIQFAAQADCDLFQCANVIASAVCIGAGISSGQVEAVFACVASGASGICPCAGCIDSLNNFLKDHGFCK